jgi:hypothetical protein
MGQQLSLALQLHTEETQVEESDSRAEQWSETEWEGCSD